MATLVLYVQGSPFATQEIEYPDIETEDLLHRAMIKKMYVDEAINDMKLKYWKQLSKIYNDYEFYLLIQPKK